MHSTVFQISHHPAQAEKPEPLQYLPDWFYETVCDCTAKISDYEREHEIQQLTQRLGSQCTRNGNKLSFSPKFKQQYFKESFRYFKAAAEALAETEYDVFAGIVPAAAFDLALSGIAESYADKRSFYVYCPDNEELSPLDNWLRKTDLSEPVYIRDAINYHF